jgi:hypothetical protein
LEETYVELPGGSDGTADPPVTAPPCRQLEPPPDPPSTQSEDRTKKTSAEGGDNIPPPPPLPLSSEVSEAKTGNPGLDPELATTAERIYGKGPSTLAFVASLIRRYTEGWLRAAMRQTEQAKPSNRRAYTVGTLKGYDEEGGPPPERASKPEPTPEEIAQDVAWHARLKAEDDARQAAEAEAKAEAAAQAAMMAEHAARQRENVRRGEELIRDIRAAQARKQEDRQRERARVV